MERNPPSGDAKEADSIRGVRGARVFVPVAVVALVIAFHEFLVHEARQEPYGPARLLVYSSFRQARLQIWPVEK